MLGWAGKVSKITVVFVPFYGSCNSIASFGRSDEGREESQ
jgi:hypothetical protein